MVTLVEIWHHNYSKRGTFAVDMMIIIIIITITIIIIIIIIIIFIPVSNVHSQGKIPLIIGDT